MSVYRVELNSRAKSAGEYRQTILIITKESSLYLKYFGYILVLWCYTL